MANAFIMENLCCKVLFRFSLHFWDSFASELAICIFTGERKFASMYVFTVLDTVNSPGW